MQGIMWLKATLPFLSLFSSSLLLLHAGAASCLGGTSIPLIELPNKQFGIALLINGSKSLLLLDTASSTLALSARDGNISAAPSRTRMSLHGTSFLDFASQDEAVADPDKLTCVSTVDGVFATYSRIYSVRGEMWWACDPMASELQHGNQRLFVIAGGGPPTFSDGPYDPHAAANRLVGSRPHDAFRAADGVLGMAYGAHSQVHNGYYLNTSYLNMLGATTQDSHLFALEFGTPASFLHLGSTAISRHDLLWSESRGIADQDLRYHQFHVFDMSMCGEVVMPNLAASWPVLLDSGASCRKFCRVSAVHAAVCTFCSLQGRQ